MFAVVDIVDQPANISNKQHQHQGHVALWSDKLDHTRCSVDDTVVCNLKTSDAEFRIAARV